jgi:hypothetical protein
MFLLVCAVLLWLDQDFMGKKMNFIGNNRMKKYLGAPKSAIPFKHGLIASCRELLNRPWDYHSSH